MAKRKAEVDEDAAEQRAVFVDTLLNTHLVLLVSPTDTVSLLKQKILLEHPKCFPDLGEIKINALKVKRRGCYYHLLDSMLVRTAFYAVAKNWFLFADVSRQIVCPRTPLTDHAIIPMGPSKALAPPVASSKHLESGINCNEDDNRGNHSSVAHKVFGLEMPSKFDLSNFQIEAKSGVEILNAGDIGDGTNKQNKKKRKRTAEHDVSGDGSGERPHDLCLNRKGKEPPTESTVRKVVDEMKSTNNVTDEASPPAHAKKKHKVVKKDAQEASSLKTKLFISDRVAPESGAVVSKSDQEEMQKSGPVDVNGFLSAADSKETRKRKKEKRHASSELPSKINKKDNLMLTEDHARNSSAPATDAVAKLDGVTNLVKDVQEGTRLHCQSEGTSTSLDKLVNNESEVDKVGLAPGSRAKKTKKAKKGDPDGVDRSDPTCASEMPDILKNGVTPTQNENDIHTQENSVTERMELGTKAKKKKVKKGKVSVREKTGRSSMENNKDTAICILSNGHLKNDTNDNFTDKADREDSTHQTDKKSDRVKTSSISSRDADQEADDARKIGAELLQTAEIDKPGVCLEIRDEKAKRKTQKKQTGSINDSPEVSVQEQSDAKTETDIPKRADVNILVNSDINGSEKLKELDRDKTSLPEVSTDVAEVRRTDRRVSKKKVKKQDFPLSVDTSCSGHNMVSPKKSRGSERTSHDGTNLKDDDREAESMMRIGTQPLQPLPIDKGEENSEIMSEKPKKRTGKKLTALKDPPNSSVKEPCDVKTRETSVPKSAGGNLLVNTVVNYPNQQEQSSLGEDGNEQLDDVLPSDSAGLAEARSQDKPNANKGDVKKMDLPSSVDNSSNQPSLSKLKSRKSKRTSPNGTRLQESITEQKQDISMPQPSEKSSGSSEEGIETQAPQADPINFAAKVALSKENGSATKGVHVGSKLSGTSSVTIGSPERTTHLGEKAKEQQKKTDANHVGSKRSSLRNMRKVVNASLQKKGLLATPGAIFEDESSASSDEHKIDGSDSSTRTPSDNLSSSDYSEGESNGDVVTSQHDSKRGGQDGTNPNSSGLKNLTLHCILRSSSRYKKAKVVASQSQLQDSEPVEVVPDSQANT